MEISGLFGGEKATTGMFHVFALCCGLAIVALSLRRDSTKFPGYPIFIHNSIAPSPTLFLAMMTKWKPSVSGL